jgi:hypothetical protein
MTGGLQRPAQLFADHGLPGYPDAVPPILVPWLEKISR